jgi:hypothetical protein
MSLKMLTQASSASWVMAQSSQRQASQQLVLLPFSVILGTSPDLLPTYARD